MSEILSSPVLFKEDEHAELLGSDEVTLTPSNREVKNIEGLEVEVSTWNLDNLLPIERLQRIRERLPQAEDEIKMATFKVPVEAIPVLALHPSFEGKVAGLARGEDVGNLLGGGASGAEIHKYLQRKSMPTRFDEYEVFRKRYPEGNLLQFQVGGWPFNLGSLFYEHRKNGIFVTTQDVVVAKAYADDPYKPPLYGKESPFYGFAVTKQGEVAYYPVNLDVTSPQALEATAVRKLENVQTYIATQPFLVEAGRGVSPDQMYGQGKNSDSRHWVALPYFGGLSSGAYGETVSGSFLMGSFNQMFLEGQGRDIWQAISRSEPLDIDVDSQSRRLAEAALQNWADPKVHEVFQRFGFSEDVVRSAANGRQVQFIPTDSLYPHLFWGKLQDGSWGVSVTTGLLAGKITGQSGLPSSAIPEVLESVGYEYALFGSQGRDTGQVFVNGVNVALTALYPEEYISRYGRDINNKLATTPSIALKW